MQKYSGGYCRLNPNFVIGGIKRPKKKSRYSGYFAIAKNLLFRGVPTRLSKLAEECLGPLEETPFFKYSFKAGANFSNIIKGGESSNPALDFYAELSNVDGAYFLPECPFCDIVPLSKTDESYAVDFYSPLLGIAIEVDGKQHEETRLSDHLRDQMLQKSGARCIRVTTGDVATGRFNDVINEIKRLSLAVPERAKKSDLEILPNGADKSLEAACFFFRLQILLLELFDSSTIDINDKECVINVSSDVAFSTETCEKAYEDIKILITNLFTLNNIDQSWPNISFVNGIDGKNTDSGIRVSLDVYTLYDEDIDSDDNCIRVATDYFLYAEKNRRDSKQFFFRYKDYYRVSVDRLRLRHVSEDNPLHVQALLYFLKLLFGYEEFRPKQIEIITHALSPADGVIGILPTGSGKSICYQLVCFLTPGISVVISPLKVLMEDQCEDLESFGITRAHYINSSDGNGLEKNRDITMRAFSNSSTKLLYISPERFFNKAFQEKIGEQAGKICQFAIDEVHCLSEWGHDFRTSYLLLFGFFKKFGFEDVLLIGTSATASPQVVNDIVAEFSRIKRRVITVKTENVKRPELTFNVIRVSEEDNGQSLASILSSAHDRGEKSLVFFAYKTTAQEYYDRFSKESLGLRVGMYHGDKGDTNLPNEVDADDTADKGKSKVLNLYKSGQIEAVFATKAFGMGVNIKDIRHCVHMQFASSVESLYQEMGRAGRDGEPSTCTVFYPYNEACENNINHLFENSAIEVSQMTERNGFYGGLSQQLFLLRKNNLDPNEEAWLAYEVLAFLKKNAEDETAHFYLKRHDGKKGILAYLEEIAASQTAKAHEAIGNMLEKTKKYSSKDLPPQTMFDKVQMFVERAMYQLYILNLIDLWEVNYGPDTENPEYTNVHVNVEEGVGNNAFTMDRLLAYIRRYEPTYSLVVPNPESQSVLFYLNALTSWSHDHFFMSRWNSLKTLHDFVINFHGSDEFAERINSYFVESKSLQDALEKPLDYRLWFSAIQADEPDQLRDRLFRAFEERGDSNVAANFISALNKIQLGDFEQHDGKGRFYLALDQIEKHIPNCASAINDTALSMLDTDESALYQTALFDYLIARDQPHPIETGFDEATKKDISVARKLRQLTALLGGRENG